ncbi:MAG: hypothetical protein KDI13_00120 [Alphaproteobacteria bacterium]|nr:hypothetical protein [Alphaproteobacteria bacterium]
MPKIEAGMRKRIAEFLPKALETAVASYKTFSDKQSHEGDPVKFKAYHDACKVALAHIELLMKLVKLADLPEPHLSSEIRQEELRSLIEAAHGDTKGFDG